MVVLILCLLIRLRFICLFIHLLIYNLTQKPNTHLTKKTQWDNKKIIAQKQNNNNNNIELVMRRDSQVNKMTPVLN